jgi:hypothetical protein
VRVTRPHHALEGQVLEVFAKLRHKGQPHFMLVLPDGSRSYIPVAWTDLVATPESSAPSSSLQASASDLLRLRQRVDFLLRRIEPGLVANQTVSNPENQHETAATGTVECRTPSHATTLPTAHTAAAQRPDPSAGPAFSQAGAKPAST